MRNSWPAGRGAQGTRVSGQPEHKGAREAEDSPTLPRETASAIWKGATERVSEGEQTETKGRQVED